MRQRSSRRAIVVLALFALLFSIDAAYATELGVAGILVIVALGGALALAMLRLANAVLHGSPAHRTRAIVVLNGIAAAPSVIMLVFIGAVREARVVNPAIRATLVWLLAAVAWTTATALAAATDSKRRREARGQTLVPLYRPQYRSESHRSATSVARQVRKAS